MAGGQDVFFRDFSKGVVAHLAPTKLTDVASPRAFNTAFSPVAGGTLGVGPRPGYREVAHSGDDDEAIIAQAFFKYTEDGTTITHHIGVRADGTLWELAPSPTQLTIPTGTGEFASPNLGDVSEGVVFVEAGNRLLGFVRNGLNFKVYRKPLSSTLYVGTIGLPQANAPTFIGTAVGSITGNLDVRVAWYNSATDTEGIPSEVYTRSCTAEGITIGLPTAGPGEADKLRIYVRNQTLSTKYARNASMEVAAGTPTFVLDFTDAQFNQMTLTPGLTLLAYSQPPTGQLCATWHLSRCFISDGHVVRYSQATNPEQFDPLSEESVNEGAGQLILGLLPLSEEMLGIFKERSIQGMAGQTPATWAFDELVPDLGCNSTRSLVQGGGWIGFWSKRGPCAWKLGGQPQLLVHETLASLVKDGEIYLDRRDQTLGVFDPQGSRFLWTLDRTDGSGYTVAPWSTVHEVWEAISWDLGPIYSFVDGPSSTSQQRVFFGGPFGAVHELSDTLRRDAATETTPAAYRTVLSGSASAIVLSAGSPSVNARQSIARLLDVETLQIHRGTYSLVGATLTWTVPSSFTPSVGSIVVFDAPIMEWDTIDNVVGAPHFEKRVLQTYAETWSTGDVPAIVAFFKDVVATPHRVFQTTFAKSMRDRDRVGPELSGAVPVHKRWGGFRCRSTRIRFVGWYPIAEWTLVHVGFSVLHHDDED